MPTYVYECSGCGEIFDIMQGMREPKLTMCDSCGENTLFRHIGTGCAILIDTSFRDEKGTKIWYPNNNNNPYYDKALNRVFKNKQDKRQFMKENKIVMDGSLDNPSRHREPAAGTTRGGKEPIYSRPIKEKVNEKSS